MVHQLGWRRLPHGKGDATAHAATAEASPELAGLSEAMLDNDKVPGEEQAVESDVKALQEERQRQKEHEEAQVAMMQRA